MNTVHEVKVLRKKLRYGDFKQIAEKAGVSTSTATQVMQGVFYNKAVVDAAKEIIKARETKN